MRIFKTWERGLSIMPCPQMNKWIDVYYLVMDAFFAIGPVFLAASVYSIALRTPLVHIITRAQKSTVAYLDPEPDPPDKRGRKKQFVFAVTSRGPIIVMFLDLTLPATNGN